MMAWYWILLLAIGWIACGVFAYRVFRRPMTENGRLPWTVSDRRFGIGVSLFGPASALAACFVLACEVSYPSNDKPAKW